MKSEPGSPHLKLAHALTEEFRVFPSVEAIAIAGSLTSNNEDASSDIDFYVYTTSVIPLAARQAIVDKFGASRADLNLQFWDLGDEWMDLKTGIEVDVIYWDTAWIQGEIDYVLVHQQAKVGYTTCFWHTLRNSLCLYDKADWFTKLHAQCQQPYPVALRDAIIAKNFPVLRDVIPSYHFQIEKALKRGDEVSVNHRVAGLLASYFDVLFALNMMPHPGEKRLVEIAERCEVCPSNLREQMHAVLQATANANKSLLQKVDVLIDDLEALLPSEKL